MKTAAHINSRGVYGQNDGSLVRGGKDSATLSFGDRLSDNRICEGREEDTLRAMFNDRSRWGDLEAYCRELRGKGWSQSRIDSVLSRATCGRLN